MTKPMTAIERKININLNKNPDLGNVFDRTIENPLIRKLSFVPF